MLEPFGKVVPCWGKSLAVAAPWGVELDEMVSFRHVILEGGYG